MKILVVEDDQAIAEPLLEGLVHHGFEPLHVRNGADAIDAIGKLPFDMILLDLGLPDIDGLDVCRTIRSHVTTPIIMLTARSDEIDRVVGLELGADDYVSKPFGLRELVARIRAVQRRFEVGRAVTADHAASLSDASASDLDGQTSATVWGGLSIDHRTRRICLHDVELVLTPKEYGVLALLAADPGAVVTRTTLLEQVWDEHWYGPTKTLDVHIAQLRQKLGNPLWIETIRSIGYRLNNPDPTPPDETHSSGPLES
jgi:two-component system, OmpR family, response regulator RegX3